MQFVLIRKEATPSSVNHYYMATRNSLLLLILAKCVFVPSNLKKKKEVHLLTLWFFDPLHKHTTIPFLFSLFFFVHYSLPLFLVTFSRHPYETSV